MTREPQNRGSRSSSESSRSLIFYSDNARMSERNYLLNTLALLPERHFFEPKSVQRRRRQIQAAEWTLHHLCSGGYPPIFTSVLYDALLRKVRK